MMSPLVWVFLSSLAWAATDVLRKKLAGPIGAAPLGALLALGALILFVPWWLATGGLPTAGYLVPAGLSLVANIGATVLLILALERGELGVVVPLLSLTPALSALGEWLSGGAAPGPQQSVGIALVVAGALLVQRDGPRFRFGSATGMAIAVAALFSMTAVLDGRALQSCPAALHGVLQSAGMALGLAAVALFQRQGHRLVPPAGTRLYLLATVVAFAVGASAQLLALEQVPASLHETVKRTIGMLAALALGALAFQESLSTQRVAAVLAMLVGVAMVLL